MEIRTDLDLEKPEAGVYSGVSFEDYVNIGAANNSVLKMFIDQSPAHARHYIENGRPETQALAFGQAADCYILEPLLFAKKYVPAPKDDDGKEYHKNTKIYKQFVADLDEGVTPLKEQEMADIISIYNCLSGSPAMALLRGGQSQLVVVWKDEPTGLLCKARLDYFNEQLWTITDLKTTRDSKPANFAKDIYNFKYFMQAAFYQDGFKQATGEDIAPSFLFFAVEKVPPFVNMAVELGERSVEAGRLCYRKALDMYAECLKTGEWKMYRDEITMIEMPDWALAQAGFGQHNMR